MRVLALSVTFSSVSLPFLIKACSVLYTLAFSDFFFRTYIELTVASELVVQSGFLSRIWSRVQRSGRPGHSLGHNHKLSGLVCSVCPHVCLCVDRAQPSPCNSGRILLGNHFSQLTRQMLWVAGPFTPHGCLFFPGLLGQPVLSVHADLCYLLFKFKTFFYHSQNTLYLISVSALASSSIPCLHAKNYPAGKFAACLDVRTRVNDGLYIAMMFNSSAQKSTRETAKAAQEDREQSLSSFQGNGVSSLQGRIWGQRSSFACVVTAVCLYGKNIFLIL